MAEKVLLMGTAGSGKTSMRSIIFANFLARDTDMLGATLDVQHDHIRFLGKLNLNLWDCGGQIKFFNNYIKSRRDNVFGSVKVLIYVFDIESMHLAAEPPKVSDMEYYRSCLEGLASHSEDAKVFVLIHKMDLVPEENRARIFEDRVKLVQRESGEYHRKNPVQCFATSIWDETLYKAWSTIVHTLIPNMAVLQKRVDSFCDICDADEVVLFERATFLMITKSTARDHHDVHRFEKISNIIKQFKLSCNKTTAVFEGMVIQNAQFTAFVDRFTSNTYIMVIVSDKATYPAATQLNIAAGRKVFEKLIQDGSE